MKFRIPIILCCAVLAIGVFGCNPDPRDIPPTTVPFGTKDVPTMDVGAVLPVDDYRLSGPYTHDNLTVFLIHGRETLGTNEFLTLEEALRDKMAIVHETGSVNQLTIENQSANADVFIQSGDIIKGGKQDRTLPYDSIIEAKSGQVPIDSFCVEHGRWSQRGDEPVIEFSSGAIPLLRLDRLIFAGGATKASLSSSRLGLQKMASCFQRDVQNSLLKAGTPHELLYVFCHGDGHGEQSQLQRTVCC